MNGRSGRIKRLSIVVGVLAIWHIAARFAWALLLDKPGRFAALTTDSVFARAIAYETLNGAIDIVVSHILGALLIGLIAIITVATIATIDWIINGTIQQES